MASLQIKCVRKRENINSHEHITHVGNQLQHWVKSREQTVKEILQGINSFYTIHPVSGLKADVRVRQFLNGGPFLQTWLDDEWNNFLLSLPECPSNL